MRSFFVIQMTRHGCLCLPEMFVDLPIARKHALSLLAESGDVEGNDVAIDEVCLVPLHVKRVVHPKEIMDEVLAAQAEGRRVPSLDILDLTAVQPMTGLACLCENDDERAAVGLLTKQFSFMVFGQKGGG